MPKNINIEKNNDGIEQDLKTDDLKVLKKLYNSKNYTGFLRHLAEYKNIGVTNSRAEIDTYLGSAMCSFIMVGHEVTFGDWTMDKLLAQNKTFKSLVKDYLKGIKDKTGREKLTSALDEDEEFNQAVAMVDILAKRLRGGKVYTVDTPHKTKPGSASVNSFASLKDVVEFLIKNYKIKFPAKTSVRTR